MRKNIKTFTVVPTHYANGDPIRMDMPEPNGHAVFVAQRKEPNRDRQTVVMDADYMELRSRQDYFVGIKLKPGSKITFYYGDYGFKDEVLGTLVDGKESRLLVSGPLSDLSRKTRNKYFKDVYKAEHKTTRAETRELNQKEASIEKARQDAAKLIETINYHDLGVRSRKADIADVEKSIAELDARSPLEKIRDRIDKTFSAHPKELLVRDDYAEALLEQQWLLTDHLEKSEWYRAKLLNALRELWIAKGKLVPSDAKAAKASEDTQGRYSEENYAPYSSTQDIIDNCDWSQAERD